MKKWNLDPPITMEEILSLGKDTVKERNHGYESKIGDLAICRAKRVFLDGKKPRDVAREDGISFTRIYSDLGHVMFLINYELRR